MRIKSIRRIDYVEDVYNLHVEDNHNYFANNHCVSNCHEFDDVMSDFISIKITETIIKRLKFANESEILGKLKKIKSIEEYIIFLSYLGIEIDRTMSSIEGGLESDPNRTPLADQRENKLGKILGGAKNKDLKLMQIITDLIQYKSKIEIFLKEYESNPNNWVLESKYNEKVRTYELSLEPIWSYDYLDKYVFSKYDMVFLMSATILDKNLFCQLNGLDVGKSTYYSINSPFPAKNRPIYYMPVGKMSYKTKEETFKKYVPYVNKILKKYDGQKGIIHTNSFELSKWFERDMNNSRLVYHDSTNKDEVLRKHFETKSASVIVSPSVDTGISFDDDRARFQIIAKIPYPSLASQKNKLRQKYNPEWYAWKTVCGVVQSYGRIVRSDKDSGDTLIIDGSFSDIMKYSGHFLPTWFQEAIKKVNIKQNA